jgi:hypothetical protein
MEIVPEGDCGHAGRVAKRAVIRRKGGRMEDRVQGAGYRA